MNDKMEDSGERLSALMDGELAGLELTEVLAATTGWAEGLVAWQSYHVVGDALRGAAPGAKLDGLEFVAQFRSRLAQEPSAKPVAMTVPATPEVVVPVGEREGANDPVWRWKLLAGAASLAAVATVGWHLASVQAGSVGALVQAPAPAAAQVTALAPAPKSAPVAATPPPTMLRDPRLDELMAAHKQLGGTSALQMPAGFLRNATFNDADR